jgi:hypothetical protein
MPSYRRNQPEAPDQASVAGVSLSANLVYETRLETRVSIFACTNVFSRCSRSCCDDINGDLIGSGRRGSFLLAKDALPRTAPSSLVPLELRIVVPLPEGHREFHKPSIGRFGVTLLEISFNGTALCAPYSVSPSMVPSTRDASTSHHDAWLRARSGW